MAKGLSRPFVLSKGGTYIMKTDERSVVVETTENGRAKRLVYPIVTDDGELMTHRLRRLLSGKLGASGGDGVRREIHFVGMVWRKPYPLLQEILQDRLALQRELIELGDTGKLTRVPPITIPERASNGNITTLMQKEMKLRDSLKRRIKRFKYPGVKVWP